MNSFLFSFFWLLAMIFIELDFNDREQWHSYITHFFEQAMQTFPCRLLFTVGMMRSFLFKRPLQLTGSAETAGTGR
jgi:hypothetical protein